MYLAINLDEESITKAQTFLQGFTAGRPQLRDKVQNWRIPHSLHVTICMGSNSKRKYNYRKGEAEIITVTGIMVGEGNIALRVKVRAPLNNDRPHITMCYDMAGGFKPKDSNNIELTVAVKPFQLNCKVKENTITMPEVIMVENAKYDGDINRLIEIAQQYRKDNNRGAYNDLLRIGEGSPMEDVSWTPQEAKIITDLWETFGEVPEQFHWKK